MNGALAYTYHDPYKLPAGIATLIVHVIFLGVLYLGINWQAQAPEGMVVNLWDSLPDVNNAPSMSVAPQETKQVQKTEPAKSSEAEQPVPQKAEIDLGKKHKATKKEKHEKRNRKMTRAEQRQAQADMAAAIRQQELAEQQAMDARAKQAAAAGQLINEFTAKIKAKIRRNIILPPDVPDKARAEFDVTLLPGGDVLDVELTRKSGNDAYDAAVERAIWKARPLPVPEDPDMFQRFRILHMKFTPKE